jgi:glycosyltransferase involved in cell wall biosynthesis
MNPPPLISICIPAYQRVNYLKRLLDSISVQTFRNFEVIVTDDSSNNSVGELTTEYAPLFTIKYQKNSSALGTPENWNEGIRLAQGQWIKIMHDDDWFALPQSLERFAELIVKNPEASFLFSGSNFVRNDEVFGGMHISKWQQSVLKKDPCNLYYKNLIGPPSVTIHRNQRHVWYDRNMKWLVDVDFYMRYLQKGYTYAFTGDALINVGYSESQVTEQVFHDKNVFVKENLMMLQKQPHAILKRIWNYDYTWRMMRNYNIKSVKELQELYPPAANNIPAYHANIISHQKYIPGPILKIGIFSKIFMTISFVISRLQN